MNQNTNTKSKSIWVIRLWALLVLLAALIVVGSVKVDSESTAWYLKAAAAVVYIFSFVGAVSMFRGTLRTDQLRPPLLNELLGVLWVLIVAAVGILVMIYVL